MNHVLARRVIDVGRVDGLLDWELHSHDCFWIDKAAVFEVNNQAMMSEEISTEPKYTGLTQRTLLFIHAPTHLDCPGGGAVRRDGCPIGRC